MKVLVRFFILFSGLLLFGQQQNKLDSLKTTLHKSETDIQIYENLNLVIRQYLQSNMDSAKVYNDRLLVLAKKQKMIV